MSFGNAPFVYDRRYPPLFFAAPVNADEERQSAQSMARVAREYFRMGSNPDNTDQTCMSNGMTLGEYAMHICVERNTKRRDLVDLLFGATRGPVGVVGFQHPGQDLAQHQEPDDHAAHHDDVLGQVGLRVRASLGGHCFMFYHFRTQRFKHSECSRRVGTPGHGCGPRESACRRSAT